MTENWVLSGVSKLSEVWVKRDADRRFAVINYQSFTRREEETKVPFKTSTKRPAIRPAIIPAINSENYKNLEKLKALYS